MNTKAWPNRASTLPQLSLRCAGMDRVGIGHALVDNCSYREAGNAIIAHAKAGGNPAYVTTANAQHIVLLDRDRRLREIYHHAALVVPDGISILLAALLYVHDLQERIPG